MKRMLMLASVASMIEQFNMSNIKLLLEMGYEVHVACNFEKGSTCTDEKITELKKTLEDIKVPYFQIDFNRNVLMLGESLKAYYQVLKLARKYRYDFIHCHSPIGGVVGRLVGHKTHTKVIYTAHGFHFFKGAPLLNWLVYYPIEKFLSRWTDVLITINREDYQRAKKSLDAQKVVYVPGVGVDVCKFYGSSALKKERYKKLGIEKNTIILLSVGELNKNKNHETIIKAMRSLPLNIQYIIVGIGNRRLKLEEQINMLGLQDRVHLLGYRSDIADVLKMVDVYILPSIREGLNMSLMEAMASCLPCICSDIRGNQDLIVEGKGGYRVKARNTSEWIDAILKLCESDMDEKGIYNAKHIKKFSKDIVREKMKGIYKFLESEE